MGRNTARVIMTIAGISILAGFFMPWFDFQQLEGASGFTILRKASMSSAWLAVLLVVPASGLLLGASGLSGVKFARYLALLVGALIIGYGAYRFFQIFFSVTGPGIWLVVIGGLIALTVGLLPERKDAPSPDASSLSRPAAKPLSVPSRPEPEPRANEDHTLPLDS